jgi:hypothetical protein
LGVQRNETLKFISAPIGGFSERNGRDPSEKEPSGKLKTPEPWECDGLQTELGAEATLMIDGSSAPHCVLHCIK